MPLLLVSSDRFGEHMTPPGHPERHQRAEVMDAVASAWRARGGQVVPPEPAPREALARVHDAAYLDRIDGLAGRSAMLDADTFASPDTVEVATLAAGAALVATGHVLAGCGPAFALVRPPGHHAERDRAMGFCLYNNAAVAAAHALARGAAKVAVVDIDVHHGNGTQWIFYGDPRVLYVSYHQYPFYPGTGAAEEVGQEGGVGFTVNAPFEAGATDGDYLLIQTRVVTPLLEAFAPDLIVLSAGFDAHERDPLGGMRLSTGGYRALVEHLHHAAARICAGRLVTLTEGGYDLPTLAACCEATIEVLSGPAAEPAAPTTGPSGRGEATLNLVQSVQRAYWPEI